YEDADVVLACIGDVPTQETIAAAELLREHVPGLRFRVVNVVDLMALAPARVHPHGLSGHRFATLFGESTEVVAAFHGYPRVLRRGEQRWDFGESSGRHALALEAALADVSGLADAVGHRVVHGGERFAGPAIVDEATREAIAALAPLAPLHTRAALEGIDAAT